MMMTVDQRNLQNDPSKEDDPDRQLRKRQRKSRGFKENLHGEAQKVNDAMSVVAGEPVRVVGPEIWKGWKYRIL